MADLNKINEMEVENVSGGAGDYNANGYRTVCGLKTGWLAMRTAPTYDYANEKRGYELYNGDQVILLSAPVAGSDGRTYVLVQAVKSGMQGYVNAAYLA
ncbi:MAG: hypothetical protein J5973_07415 [Eubacterium sp.]|nr:hypothetical protein [Eubacterium sp.]